MWRPTPGDSDLYVAMRIVGAGPGGTIALEECDRRRAAISVLLSLRCVHAVAQGRRTIGFG